MTRKNLSVKLLAKESAAITQFVFDTFEPACKTKMPIQMAYDAYEQWRKLNRMPVTKLTVDGFGRLFPKAYRRGPAYWPPVKHSLKCVFDISFRR